MMNELSQRSNTAILERGGQTRLQQIDAEPEESFGRLPRRSATCVVIHGLG